MDQATKSPLPSSGRGLEPAPDSDPGVRVGTPMPKQLRNSLRKPNPPMGGSEPQHELACVSTILDCRYQVRGAASAALSTLRKSRHLSLYDKWSQ